MSTASNKNKKARKKMNGAPPAAEQPQQQQIVSPTRIDCVAAEVAAGTNEDKTIFALIISIPGGVLRVALPMSEARATIDHLSDAEREFSSGLSVQKSKLVVPGR